MWHFNALWKVKNYSLNPRICIIHTFCFSLCVPGKMCETLVSVQRELQPDWRNGTGLAQKAGALFSSAGITLHSAPFCMCLRAKAVKFQHFAGICVLDLAHLERWEAVCTCLCVVTWQLRTAHSKKDFSAGALDLEELHTNCLEFWKWPIHCKPKRKLNLVMAQESKQLSK